MKKFFLMAAFVLVGVSLLWYYGISSYLTLEALQARSHILHELVQKNYVLSIVIYIGLYTALIACGMPVVAPLSIIGGFLFGLYGGFSYALVSAVIGSFIYFLMARYVLGHLLRNRYLEKLDSFNGQIVQYGYTYLLTLHFLTIVPFFVINTLAAFAHVPIWPFLWTTILGCMPTVFIYVLAGRELSTLQSVRDVFKLEILLVFLLLAILALAPMVIRTLRAKFYHNNK